MYITHESNNSQNADNTEDNRYQTDNTTADNKTADTDSKNSTDGSDAQTVVNIPNRLNNRKTDNNKQDAKRFYKYEVKQHKKMFRILTVIAYVICVSMAAIVLSLYYGLLWDPYMTKYRPVNCNGDGANCNGGTVKPVNCNEAVTKCNENPRPVKQCAHLIKRVKTDADLLAGVAAENLTKSTEKLRKDAEDLAACILQLANDNSDDKFGGKNDDKSSERHSDKLVYRENFNKGKERRDMSDRRIIGRNRQEIVYKIINNDRHREDGINHRRLSLEDHRILSLEDATNNHKLSLEDEANHRILSSEDSTNHRILSSEDPTNNRILASEDPTNNHKLSSETT